MPTPSDSSNPTQNPLSASESPANSAPSTLSPALKPGVGVRVFQNTVAILAGRALGLLLSAATSILLARFLGRQLLGEYGAIFAYVALYAFFSTFCLEQILAREISLRPDQAASLFRTGTQLALVFSIFGAVLAFLLAPLFGYSGMIRWFIVIASLDLLILPPFKLRGIIFQVQMKLWFSVAVGLLRQLLWLLAVFLLAMKNAAFYQVMVARTLCSFVELFANLWLVRRSELIRGPAKFLPREARRMFRDG